MIIKNFQSPELHINEFVSIPGASWCFWGDNLSGIAKVHLLLSGELPAAEFEILQLPEKPGILSFSSQQKVFENELRNDDTDFLDHMDPGTLVREFLPDWQDHLDLLTAFNLHNCLDRGYRQLSSGQCRKLHLIDQLVRGARTIVIQNPYEGLDQQSVRDLDSILSRLPGEGIELILLVNTFADIPDWCSHLGLFTDGRLECHGDREAILPLLEQRLHNQDPATDLPEEALLAKDAETDNELIRLENGFAAYGARVLFTNLNILVNDGDHTLISGPNGCGKSTLLEIITGDNPKCYMNELYLFGQRRGSGESIWEIKKHMGIVSPALHRAYRAGGTLLHVILSGLHDSIGLYRTVHAPEIRIARKWLSWIGLDKKEKQSFHSLSYAEQRLVLICRALIKKPQLLILDEPSQGLDDHYRTTLMTLLDNVAANRLATILFVSHRQDEWRPFFRQHIQLDTYGARE